MAERIERSYIIPLRRGLEHTPPLRRAKRAVSVVKEFLVRHMRCKDVRIGQALNTLLWSRGIRNPPHKVSIVAVKEEDVVRAELSGHTWQDAIKSRPKKESGGGLKERITRSLTGGSESATAQQEKPVTEKKESSAAKTTADLADEKTTSQRAHTPS